MKKVFISQPMNGRTLEEIQAEREKLKEEAKRDMPYDKLGFLYSIITDEPPNGDINQHLWYLGKSLQIMATADIVIFADGWEDSIGCSIEYDCAMNYDLEIWM